MIPGRREWAMSRELGRFSGLLRALLQGVGGMTIWCLRGAGREARVCEVPGVLEQGGSGDL